jgi:hypothetical protein
VASSGADGQSHTELGGCGHRPFEFFCVCVCVFFVEKNGAFCSFIKS